MLLGYGLIGGLLLAPADYYQGDAFRIIYVHVPCAFLSLFVYSAMSLCAFLAIVWRLKLAFIIMRQSIPLGTAFTFLALVTGSIWGKPMWGTWWIWDARLTSELILLFLYLAIGLFDSALNGKKHADRLVAIFILVGFVDIPIIHYSVNWWNTLHQGTTLAYFDKPHIHPSMLYPLIAMIAAFLIYYTLLIFLRLRYELVAVQKNYHWMGSHHG